MIRYIIKRAHPRICPGLPSATSALFICHVCLNLIYEPGLVTPLYCNAFLFPALMCEAQAELNATAAALLVNPQKQKQKRKDV